MTIIPEVVPLCVKPSSANCVLPEKPRNLLFQPHELTRAATPRPYYTTLSQPLHAICSLIVQPCAFALVSMPHDERSYELATRSNPASTEEEVEDGARVSHLTPHDSHDMEDESLAESGLLDQVSGLDEQLNRRTLRKLDFILLPFLSTLFLLNSVDKSNIGNAETAGTKPYIN